MSSLPHPDRLYLQAAQGWFELGNFLEANAELELVSPASRTREEVLKLRCQIFLKLKSWFGTAEIADKLIESFPAEQEGWLARAVALRELNQTEEAYEVLLKAALRHFPEEWEFAYKLSCYAAILRRFESSKKWFKKAILLDEKKTQRLGINEPDLAALWDSMSTTIWQKDK